MADVGFQGTAIATRHQHQRLPEAMAAREVLGLGIVDYLVLGRRARI